MINIKYEPSTVHKFKTLIVHVYSMIPMHELIICSHSGMQEVYNIILQS